MFFPRHTCKMGQWLVKFLRRVLCHACAMVACQGNRPAPARAGRLHALLQQSTGRKAGSMDREVVEQKLESLRRCLQRIDAKLKNPVIYDGRNLYDPKLVRGLGIAVRE